MRSYFPTLVAAAALATLGACASGSRQETMQTNRVRDTAGVRESDRVATASETTLNAAPATTMAALDAAYADLGIEVKLRNSNTGEIGNRKFSRMGRLAGQPLSVFVGCGWTSVGPAADNYRVTMSLVSRVTPSATGSKVETRMTAYAEDMSSSKGTVSCETRGILEERLHELAVKHAGG